MERECENRVLLLQNPNLQPFLNLAVEGFLLENLPPYKHALYLWQNNNTVVIGLNQNASAEVSATFDGYVSRRLSGGGAVYHDAGNLNFTFVSQKNFYSVDNNNKILIKALENLGLKAELSGRNDVTIDGRKISGQAFCLRQESCFHHGTILIESNVEQMRKALTPSKLKLQSKGVASVVSRVGNLKDWNPDITVEAVKKALADAFREFYVDSHVDEREVDLTDPKIVAIAEKLSSKEWVWGKNPKAAGTLERRFGWGTVQVNIETKGDKVINLDIWTDSMNTDWVSDIKHKLLLTPLYRWREIEAYSIEEIDFIKMLVED